MVLAAGLGTRLRPLTNDRPKALVDVGGRPLITYNLALLRTFGITEVVINLHHHGDMLRSTLGDGSAFGLAITYSPEDPLLDTGGGIKHAEAFLSGDDFLVLNSDTIIDLPLDLLIASHRARRAAATLVVRRDPDQERYGLIEIDASERIRRLRGEPANVSGALTPFMFAGVHVISPQVFRFMPAGGVFSITHETYPAMIAADAALYGYPFSGFWRVIDSPADRERAGRELSTTRFQHLRIASV
jgi:NDP-sugar pyrophosphorylase family protein